MKFLEELGFESKVILELEGSIPPNIKNKIIDFQGIVIDNISYLKNIGVTNYTEAFKSYYDMFLIDTTNFKEIFEKYDREDLIDKLKNNLAIIEHL